MTDTTTDNRNEHGELTARVTKAPDVDANPRAPIELLCVPMRDCTDGWKVRVRGRRADGSEGELVLYGLTASEAVRAAVEAWLGAEGAHPTQLLERVLALRERRGAGSGGEGGEPEGDVDRVTAPHAETVEAAEQLRRVIARRRDRLVAVQRRGYSTARAALIERLAADYDATLAIARAAGAELGLGLDDEDAQWCAVCSAYGQRTLAVGQERDLVAADDGSGPRRTGEPIWTCSACGEELRRYPEA